MDMHESVGDAAAPATLRAAGTEVQHSGEAKPPAEKSAPPQAHDSGKSAGCDLCEAARMTAWYSEDDVCWIADCEICNVPMVVWRSHGANPPPAALDHMLAELGRVGTERFGEGGFSIDRVMRQIPDHFHAHARDPGWWWRRFAR